MYRERAGLVLWGWGQRVLALCFLLCLSPLLLIRVIRITPVGRLLRSLKVDDFFQLINVIKGDMLLIGPRLGTVSGYNALTSREREIVTVFYQRYPIFLLYLCRRKEFC